jgi:hypothetical protein
MADPVAWTLIEPGWAVVDVNGDDAGHIVDVTGDSTIDIFNGLAIGSGPFGKPKYVPSEQVAEITEGRVRLSLANDQLAQLGDYEEPPLTADVLPDDASAVTRAEEALVGSDVSATRVPLLRRVWVWLKRSGTR